MATGVQLEAWQGHRRESTTDYWFCVAGFTSGGQQGWVATQRTEDLCDAVGLGLDFEF